MSTRKIAIVVNPAAGRGRAKAVAGLLVGRLYHFAVEYHLFEEQWPDAFDSFTEVWIVGGDGTLNYFINRYPDINIPLALFKGGTGDDFAWKLYGEANWKQQMEQVWHATAKPIDVGCCNDRYFFNCVGIGFEGEVLRSMDTIRKIGGHVGYYLVVLKKIFSFRENRFQISAGEKRFDEKLLLATVNNSSRTGGGFHISPQSDLADGLLDLVICKPLTIWKRLRYLPQIEKGKHLHLPFIKSVSGTHFTIECEKSLPAQMDGELIYGNRFEIKILPAKYKFLF
jgi:YegS/Rv2252/BmrU family lipid kinase